MKAKRILVDTNVWIANYLPTREGHKSSRSFLRAAWANDVMLLYPAPIIKDVFYLLGLEYKRQIRNEKGMLSDGDAAVVNELAWGCVENMREVATAVGVDETDIWTACKYKRLSKDFEDNLVIAAALRAEADHIVTLDQKLLKKAPISALVPDDIQTLLEI